MVSLVDGEFQSYQVFFPYSAYIQPVNTLEKRSASLYVFLTVGKMILQICVLQASWSVLASF